MLLSLFAIPGTNKPFDAFHLKIPDERLRFSVHSGKEHLPSRPSPAPSPWDCSGPRPSSATVVATLYFSDFVGQEGDRKS